MFLQCLDFQSPCGLWQRPLLRINTKPCYFLRIFCVRKIRCPVNRWRLMRIKINRPASPTYILLLYVLLEGKIMKNYDVQSRDRVRQMLLLKLRWDVNNSRHISRSSARSSTFWSTDPHCFINWLRRNFDRWERDVSHSRSPFNK